MIQRMREVQFVNMQSLTCVHIKGQGQISKLHLIHLRYKGGSIRGFESSNLPT
jgi:hypothetical protein